MPEGAGCGPSAASCRLRQRYPRLCYNPHMSGKEMYEGQTKQGKPYVIRHPREGDVKALCSYINALSKERTFIGFQGEQISEEEEERWLKKQLEKIHDKKAVQ